jgi:hypothetical protein
MATMTAGTAGTVSPNQALWEKGDFTDATSIPATFHRVRVTTAA